MKIKAKKHTDRPERQDKTMETLIYKYVGHDTLQGPKGDLPSPLTVFM